MTVPRHAGAAAGYVVATALSFPYFVRGQPLDLGSLVSWFSPALLLLAIRGLGPRAAALRGLWLGLFAHAVVLHWVYVVTVHYGHAAPVLGVLSCLGLALYPAVFTAAFAGLTSWLERYEVRSVFVLAALWAALDYAKSWFLTGFPWATLGYAQHENTWLTGLASLTGVYGLSFGVALAGAGVARAWQARRPTPEVWAALGVVAALHVLGVLARPEPIAEDALHVRVAAIQGNVDQGEKWSPERFERTLRDYERGTREASRRGAQLVVWPESAVTAAVELDQPVRARITALVQETGVVVVFGSMGAAPHPDGGVAYYDSAFFVAPDEGWLGRYDKTHLVPFGEYVPYRWLIGRVAGAIARGISSRDVMPGLAPAAASLPLRAEGTGGRTLVRVGVPICYELVFPDLVRRFVFDGAGVLLAITNDAWYGRSGAPYQFLAMTAMRSAETGVWTVRAANTGVSAVIDERGRVRDETSIFESAVLVADVPIRQAGFEPTVYVRFGDWFALGCWAATVAALGWALVRSGRATSEHGARGV